MHTLHRTKQTGIWPHSVCVGVGANKLPKVSVKNKLFAKLEQMNWNERLQSSWHTLAIKLWKHVHIIMESGLK